MDFDSYLLSPEKGLLIFYLIKIRFCAYGKGMGFQIRSGNSDVPGSGKRILPLERMTQSSEKEIRKKNF
jgi:hypothetical protein